MKKKILLSEVDKVYITNTYRNTLLTYAERMSILCKYLNRSERNVRYYLNELGLKRKFDNSHKESEQYKEAQSRQHDKTKKRFIITWAQNNTTVHKEFFSNIKVYAEFLDAEIHVIAGRYKNPTSVFGDKHYDFWDKLVEPYLDANRHDIHKYISILSDVKIQPTAVNTLSGMEGITGVNSCVVGSPKVQMQVVPALEGYKPKVMMTTGACTNKNYTDSKAGKKGEFHHTLGFVIVEIKDDNKFFARQVTANDKGEFNDLFYNTSRKQVSRNNGIEAIVLGDVHFGHHDEKLLAASIQLIKKLNPKNIVLHDVFDGHSISHHELKDPFKQFERERDGSNSLDHEINVMLDNLEQFKDWNTTIVRSNHDDFIDRWLQNTDWRKTSSYKNSLCYMEFATLLLKGKAKKGIIPYLINERFPNFNTLGRNDSLIVKGWELGQHGDIGTNGSRGSLEQFRKMNTKIIVGHYHSPGRKDGSLSVGTSTHLRVGYNIGPSSWMQSHVIVDNYGKAQHINFIDGEYTTFE